MQSAEAGVLLPRPPWVVTQQATSSPSLTAIGTPCSGPGGSPAAIAASSLVASLVAWSVNTTENALRAGSRNAMRDKHSRTVSVAVVCPAAIRRANSTADVSSDVVSSQFIPEDNHTSAETEVTQGKCD
jgi:hypothetical protein